MRTQKNLALSLVLIFSLMIINNVYAYQLIDPLLFVNSTTPVPVGIASYGLQNVSAVSGPYQIVTNEIVGVAKINSIQAYNYTPPANASVYGATLQLNAVLNITSVNNTNYSYWIQDVMDLNTSNSTYEIGDNVWNMSSITGSVSNATVTGAGNASYSPTPINFTTYNISSYSYFPNTTYSVRYPLYFIPVIRVYQKAGYPVVQIGYRSGGQDVFYDNVTFHVRSAAEYFLVTPYYETPPGANFTNSTDFYDSEFVIGGEANGEISSFSNTNVSLWMGYLNGSVMQPFPYVGVFGSDTAEAAQGLRVVQSGGNATVTTGTLDYNETLQLAGVPSVLAASSNATIPIIANNTAINQNAQNSQSGSLSSVLQAPIYSYVLLVLIIALILVLFLISRIMRRVGKVG